jgi:hypothetical protein
VTARRGQRQHGGCIIVCAMLLVPLVTALGVAVDVSVAYSRRGDMQLLADGVAVAAAGPLDGTLGGVERAVARAAATASAHASALALPVGWTPAALRLGASADGPWLDPRSVDANAAATLAYADVDTAAFDAPVGTLPALLARAVGNRDLMISVRAVAARAASPVAPLALCAIGGAPRSFGFQRGDNYLLIGPSASATLLRTFLVNPLDFPPMAERASHRSDAAVTPFISGASLAAPVINAGSQVYITAPFPSRLAGMFAAPVLYVPLLDCSATLTPTATVLALGRFVPSREDPAAAPRRLRARFDGVVSAAAPLPVATAVVVR